MAVPARKTSRIDIAGIRRQQIVEAAIAVIAEQGIQNLSLSEIESKVGMSRGQLTYYFKTKEDILLAVFDRLVEMMRQQRHQGNGADEACFASWQEVVRHVLGAILQRPPSHPEFGPLQYTFLSQISHRDDFRERLARLYQEWRTHMAELVAGPLRRRKRGFAPRTFASVVQAIFHGVAIQVAAEPNAFDREEIVNLCLDMVGTYLGHTHANGNGRPLSLLQERKRTPRKRPNASNGVRK